VGRSSPQLNRKEVNYNGSKLSHSVSNKQDLNEVSHSVSSKQNHSHSSEGRSLQQDLKEVSHSVNKLSQNVRSRHDLSNSSADRSSPLPDLKEESRLSRQDRNKGSHNVSSKPGLLNKGSRKPVQESSGSSNR
jgi:hypothetical protein